MLALLVCLEGCSSLPPTETILVGQPAAPIAPAACGGAGCGCLAAPCPTVADGLARAKLSKAASTTVFVLGGAGRTVAIYQEPISGLTIDAPNIRLTGEVDSRTGSPLAIIDTSEELCADWVESRGPWATRDPAGVWSTTVMHICSTGERIADVRQLFVDDRDQHDLARQDPALAWQWLTKVQTEAALFVPGRDDGWSGEKDLGFFDPPVRYWDGIEGLFTFDRASPPSEKPTHYVRFRQASPHDLDLRATMTTSPTLLVKASGVTVENLVLRGASVVVEVQGEVDGVVIRNNRIVGGLIQVLIQKGRTAARGPAGTRIEGNELTPNIYGQSRPRGVPPGAWDALSRWGVRAHQWYVWRHRNARSELLRAISVLHAGRGTVVSGNRLHGGLNGIKVERTADVAIARNRIENMAGAGILIDCGATDVRIEENAIADAHKSIRFQTMLKGPKRTIRVIGNNLWLPERERQQSKSERGDVGDHLYAHVSPPGEVPQCPLEGRPPDHLAVERNTFVGGRHVIGFDPRGADLRARALGSILQDAHFSSNVLAAGRYLQVSERHFYADPDRIGSFTGNWVGGEYEDYETGRQPDGDSWFESSNVASRDPPILPLGSWRFDGDGSDDAGAGGPGTTGFYGRHIVASEVPPDTGFTAAGRVGKAVDLQGTGFLTVDPLRPGAWVGDMSMELWLKPANWGTTGSTDWKTNLATDGVFRLYHADSSHESRLHFLLRIREDTAIGVPWAGWAGVSSRARFDDQSWRHVVVVKEGTGMALYVDGELDRKDDEILYGVTVDFSRRHALRFGDREGPSGSFFTGQIDEAVLYPYALSAAEVSQRYSR